MRRLVAIGFAILALAAVADPYLGYVYPCGIQAGTTNRFVIGGQRLRDIRTVWISGKGVRSVKIENVPDFPSYFGANQNGFLDKWLRGVYRGKTERPELPAADKLRTWTRHDYLEQLDQLGDYELSLAAHRVYMPRNTLQDVPSLRNRIIVTIVAERDAAPGKRTLAVCDRNGISAVHAFFVTAEPHERDQLYTPAYIAAQPPRIVTLPVILDGRITAHNDVDAFRLQLKAGRLTCALTGRELEPFIGDAVPGFFNPVLRLCDGNGHVVATADDFHFLPDPVLECQVPSNGVYRLEVSDNLFRGRDDFVYMIRCSQEAGEPAAGPRRRAFTCFARPEVHAPPTKGKGVWVANGCVQTAGRESEHELKIAAPGKREVQLYARRLGSPLDGVVRLYSPAGAMLAEWDDVTNVIHVGSVPQSETDAVGIYDFPKAGRYRLAVYDAAGRSGSDYTYTLAVKAEEPDFEVYATKSSFFFGRHYPVRSRVKMKVVRRGGFKGEIRLDETDEFRFEPAKIPAGTNEFSVAVVAKRRKWKGMRAVSLTASAAIGKDQRLTRAITPADQVEQAFAYTHLLTQPKFHMWMAEKTNEREREWPEIPKDPLFGNRILLDHAELAANVDERAFDALTAVDVPIAPLPNDADEGVLLARLAASAVKFPKYRRVALKFPLAVAFATDSDARNDECAAYAAMAGINRLINRDYTFHDGSTNQLRVLARATSLAEDNDVLLLIPEGVEKPMPSLIAAARRLRDAGWCFDFVSAHALPNAPGRYRMLVIPPMPARPSPMLTRKLVAYQRANACTIVWDDGKIDFRSVKTSARRESVVDGIGLRLSRWQNGWYFVVNCSAEPIGGKWCFATVKPSKPRAFTLQSGESAWMRAN